MKTAKNMSAVKKTVELKLTLSLSRDLPDITDLIAGRIYIMEGVEDATATLVDPTLPAAVAANDAENTAPINAGFDAKIQAFNRLYDLPCNGKPTMLDETRAAAIMRIERFMSILREELGEGKDIMNFIDSGADQVDVLTDIADWLGDIMVYCASELAKYGLRSEDVLGIIMASNMSKLGEDGRVIKDERGKVMKGPGYWQPEPMIKRMIVARLRSEG